MLYKKTNNEERVFVNANKKHTIRYTNYRDLKNENRAKPLIFLHESKEICQLDVEKG